MWVKADFSALVEDELPVVGSTVTRRTHVSVYDHASLHSPGDHQMGMREALPEVTR